MQGPWIGPGPNPARTYDAESWPHLNLLRVCPRAGRVAAHCLGQFLVILILLGLARGRNNCWRNAFLLHVMMWVAIEFLQYMRSLPHRRDLHTARHPSLHFTCVRNLRLSWGLPFVDVLEVSSVYCVKRVAFLLSRQEPLLLWKNEQ